MQPGDTTGDTKTGKCSVSRNAKGNRSYSRASRPWNAFLQRSGSHFVGEAASFGAKEATICSKRGSPRSESLKVPKAQSSVVSFEPKVLFQLLFCVSMLQCTQICVCW